MDRPVVTTSNTGEMDSAGGTGGGGCKSGMMTMWNKGERTRDTGTGITWSRGRSLERLRVRGAWRRL